MFHYFNHWLRAVFSYFFFFFSFVILQMGRATNKQLFILAVRFFWGAYYYYVFLFEKKKKWFWKKNKIFRNIFCWSISVYIWMKIIKCVNLSTNSYFSIWSHKRAEWNSIKCQSIFNSIFHLKMYIYILKKNVVQYINVIWHRIEKATNPNGTWIDFLLLFSEKIIPIKLLSSDSMRFKRLRFERDGGMPWCPFDRWKPLPIFVMQSQH